MKVSNVPHEMAHAQLERAGDLPESLQRNFLFGSFDLANVISGKIGFLRQFFLADPDSLALNPNGFSKRSIDFPR